MKKNNCLIEPGALELSMHDFQMNLAADVIEKAKAKGEQNAIRTNLAVARRVRQTVKESDGTLPERLPLEPPIKEVKKRIERQKKLLPNDPSAQN